MRAFKLSLNNVHRLHIGWLILVCGLAPSQCWAQLDATPDEVTVRSSAEASDVTSLRRDRRGALVPVVGAPGAEPVRPLSNRDRFGWIIESSVGVKSLGAGVISASWGVARDSPDEYGANWRGFGKRYALRLSGVAIGNAIEAGVGGLWGEDPRYERVGKGPIWRRAVRAGQWTIFSRHPDGRMRPAYARGIGIVGNNFITNAWRVESDRSVADALSRSGVGITSRYVSNLFEEFLPDIRRVVLRR